LVPDGYDILRDSGCTLSFSSDMTFKSSEYKDTLKSSVHGDFSRAAAAFEASAEWNTFHTHTGSGNTKQVSSMAECSLYIASVNRFSQPNYTQNFEAALSTLPTSYGDGSAYFNLFESFGTHALSSVKMGASFGFRSYFSERNWSNVANTGVAIGLAAQYEATVKAGGGLNVSFERDVQKTFEQNMQDYDVISLGSKPTEGDPLAWAQQAIQEPMPIDYHLVDLCDVIADQTLRSNCIKASQKEEYCTKRIKARGDIQSCDGVSDASCVWIDDCPSSKECQSHFCVSPSKTGHVEAIDRFWNDDNNYNTFHPAPAWSREHTAGSNIFYAMSMQVTGAVPINRYWNDHHDDNTFHPSPAWDGERNAGSSIFYAYDHQVQGTVAINRYWNDNDGVSSFHPAPEWPNERKAGNAIFYAYQHPASCAAHPACAGGSSGDCCPTASGTWLSCCDASFVISNATSMVQADGPSTIIV